MKIITTKKPIELKNGSTIPTGTKLTYVRHGENIRQGVWLMEGIERKLSYRGVLKSPSINTLEKWEGEGYCKSVFGARTEMDGYGPDGEPSWALALGLV
jgi:hypothetical protein